MNSPYTSETLVHFVGHADPKDHQKNFNILTKILSNSCVSHPPHENNHGTVGYTIDWDCSLMTEGLIVPSVTCFADIPETSLQIHIKKYSPFGISFLKHQLIFLGARPVIYIPIGPLDGIGSIHGKMLLKDLEAIYRGFTINVSSKQGDSEDEWVTQKRTIGTIPQDEPSAIQAMEIAFAKEFLAFIKPFTWNLENDHPDNFYMEREWRKYGNLKFTPDWVHKVFVADGYKSKMASVFPAYGQKIEEIKAN